MEEKKDHQKRFNTCLGGFPFAEAMQKMLGQQGIGSLCNEMMRSMMRKCCGIKEETKETREEESHVGEKQ